MPLTIAGDVITTAKKYTGFASTPGVALDYVAIHYPATDSLSSALKALKSGGKAYHIIIDRDGSLHQLAAFTRKSAHAGYSDWKGKNFLNGHSVAVSLVNAGRLKPSGGSFVSSTGGTYPAAHVADGKPRLPTSGSALGKWEKFSTAQLDACEAVLTALAAAYPSLIDIVGHDEISMGRRDDPGPLFPWDRYRSLFAKAATDFGPVLTVKSGGAPLRKTHDPGSSIISNLAVGTKVHLRSSVYKEHFSGSTLVSTTKTGMVAVALSGSTTHAGFMERSRLA